MGEMAKNVGGQATIRTVFRDLTLPVWVIVIGTFVNTVGSFLMLFLTLYLTQKGLSPYHAGIALGAWGVGRIFGAFVGGSIADRIGYRFTMALSMFTTAVLMIGLVFAANEHNPWLVTVAALGTASVNGIWRPPAQALITELTPQQRLVMVMAIWRLAFNAGMFVAPVLGAFLSRYSWDLLFWTEAGSSAVFGLLVLAAMPNRRAEAAEAAASAAAASAESTATKVAPPKSSYLRVLTDGRFVFILIALVINAIVYIQAPTVLSLHLHDLGYATEVFGALASLNALMVIALEIPITKVTQRFQPRTAIVVGMALTGAGLSVYSAPLGLLGLVTATVVWTMGEVIASPSMIAYPGLVAPPESRGRYIAAATVCNQAGYSIGPVVGTAVWAGMGGQVFWLCGIFSVVAVAATLIGARTIKKIEESAGPAETTETTSSTVPA